MSRLVRAVFASMAVGGSVLAQAPTIPAPVATEKAAAMVNGRPIPESMVERALKPVAKENRERARIDIVGFLIENALVDQYLELLKVAVDPKDVATQFETFKKDVADAKQNLADVLKKMEVTEDELKKEIHNQLRWDKFVAAQVTDEKLKRLFETSPEIFDGTTVRARHILITPATQDEAGRAAALAKATQIKAGLEKALAVAAADTPAGADALTKQKHLQKATETAFAAAARENSSCKSKHDGGDLGEFPRMGLMVEPFAKAAFAAKPFEMTAPVQSPFGYHLILVTNRNNGQKPDFDKVKQGVAEVYAAKLREAIVDKMRNDPNTKIEIIK